MIPSNRPTTPPPSAVVRLEVNLLEPDEAPTVPPPDDEHASRTVLVVSAEWDLCRYVRECLRERADVRVQEAASIAVAVKLAADGSAPLLIVDARERAILGALPHLNAIVIVDNVEDVLPTPRVRLLEQPFTAERLLAEADLYL